MTNSLDDKNLCVDALYDAVRKVGKSAPGKLKAFAAEWDLTDYRAPGGKSVVHMVMENSQRGDVSLITKMGYAVVDVPNKGVVDAVVECLGKGYYDSVFNHKGRDEGLTLVLAPRHIEQIRKSSSLPADVKRKLVGAALTSGETLRDVSLGRVGEVVSAPQRGEGSPDVHMKR